MRRIPRYILGELLKIFLMTLTGMTLLMLLAGVLQEGMRQGLGPGPIVRLIPYVLPNALLFAVPGSMLFAVCSVYGGMSASNEIVALKSLGIPPTQILTPAVVLSFLLSLLAVWLNDLAVSWGREGMQRVVLHSIEDIVYGMLATKRTYANDKISINVKRVEGRKLIRPTFSVYVRDGGSPTVITAEEAELRLDPKDETLSILLTNSEADFGNNRHAADPGTFEYKIPLTAALRKGQTGGGPSHYALWQIPQEKENAAAEIVKQEQILAAEAAYQLMLGDFQAIRDPTWNLQYAVLTNSRSRLFRLQTEPWRRWANGFSCFFFVLVGAPLSIRLRNSDLWTTFGLCFLPILISYYPLLMYGVDRAKSGDLPPYSVWLGNFILLAIGSWLIRRIMRY